MLGPDLHTIGRDELKPRHADKAEHAALVGFEMLARGGWRARAIKSAARNRNDDALVAGQSFRAVRAVAKSLARNGDAVDPGLELARERKIVHGRAEHQDVGGKELVQHLARVGDKWSVFVIMKLFDGPKRFNEIKRMIDGISQRMLTLTLRGLERDGLVTRSVYPTIPPRVDYELTDLGRDLLKPVSALGDWAVRNRTSIQEARQSFDASEGPLK